MIANLYKVCYQKIKILFYLILQKEIFGEGWHLFQLNIDFNSLNLEKENFIKYLQGFSIGTQVHYIPLVLQPYYSKNFEKKISIWCI